MVSQFAYLHQQDQLVDLVANLKTEATKDEICAAMKEAAEGPMKGILEIH